MVNGQKISYQKLISADPKKRDEMFEKAYEITDEELEQVRSMPTKYERMVSAAQLLFFRSEDPKQLTVTNIAAIAAPAHEWEGEKTQTNYSRVLSRKLRREKKTREAASGLKMTSIHLLREKVGAYDGNIEEAAKVWGGKIAASDNDWLRSVMIPQEIDYATSQFLGMVWGDGDYSHHCYNNSNDMRMGGKANDRELYENIVSEAAKMLFNLDSPVKTIADKMHAHGKDYDCERNLVSLNSKAIFSWIVECLGFPKQGEEFKLPKVDYDKQAFFEGLFASKGLVKRLNKEGCTCDTVEYEITSTDGQFIEAVDGLLNELGYSPTRYSNRNDGVTHLCIGRNADRERIQLINPRHRKIVEEKDEYNKPDPDSPLLSYDEAKMFLAEGMTSRQIFERFNVDRTVLQGAAMSTSQKKRRFAEVRAAEA
jgi:hypothetical protein